MMNDRSDQAQAVRSLRKQTAEPGQGPGGGELGPAPVEEPFPRSTKVSRTPPSQHGLEKGDCLDSSGVGIADSNVAACSTDSEPPSKVAPIFGTLRDLSKSTTPKRKAALLDDGVSTSSAGSESKRRCTSYLERLAVAINDLQKLTVNLPKSRTDIKDCALKLVSLVQLAELQRKQENRIVQDAAPTAETAECSTQTVSPVAMNNEIWAAEIRSKFEDIGEITDLLSMDWPRCAFHRTSIIRGGVNKVTEGSARVIITRPGEIITNAHLQRMAAIFPLVKKLNPKVLAPGKLATIRCEEAIEIDGQTTGNGKEFIIVGCIESTDPKCLHELTAKVMEEARKNHAKKMVMVFPPDIVPTLARKVTEIVCEGTDLLADIYASKEQRAGHNKETVGNPRKEPRNRDTSIVLKTNAGAKTYSEILSEFKTKVSPAESGVEIRSLHEKPDGRIQVILKGNKADGKKNFLQNVQKTMGETMSFEEKKVTVMVEDIEAGCTAADVQAALCEGLSIGKEEVAMGNIITNRRGNRMMFIGMDKLQAHRAADLGSIRLQWTRARIRIKFEPDYCYKCQNFGHMQSNCKNEKVDKRCRKCGEVGHVVSGCSSSETACFSCKVKGHRSDSMDCPVYRKLVRAKSSQC